MARFTIAGSIALVVGALLTASTANSLTNTTAVAARVVAVGSQKQLQINVLELLGQARAELPVEQSAMH